MNVLEDEYMKIQKMREERQSEKMGNTMIQE